MTKYPIGVQDFEKIRTAGYLYFDKTEAVYRLANEGNCYFISRPRRFGKSLLISTLEAYFRGRKELFKGLAIEQLEKDWTEYPVLHLDLNAEKYTTPESLANLLNDTLARWEDIYGTRKEEDTLALRFSGIIRRAAEKTGRGVVVLVDEYDKPLLQSITNRPLQDEYRSILKAFYGCLKSQDRYIHFALLTGVTRFGKVSIFSDLNNLRDISMESAFQTICGVTEEELTSQCQEGISLLAKQNGITYDECLATLRRRYDGYHFCAHGVGMYNPFSLLNALASREFGSYWFATGTPTFLVELLKESKFSLPDLTQQQVSSDLLSSIEMMYENPTPVLYQSGYLTINDYDREFQTYTLTFPNNEVSEGFNRFLMPYYSHVRRGEEYAYIKNLTLDLRGGRPEDFMRRMQCFFAGIGYDSIGETEKYFHNAFFIICRLLGIYVDSEYTISDGRLDLLARTHDYLYIFEFKYNQTADAALAQIEEKGYAAPFAGDPRKLYKVGVNFSSEHRGIDEWRIVEG